MGLSLSRPVAQSLSRSSHWETVAEMTVGERGGRAVSLGIGNVLYVDG